MKHICAAFLFLLIPFQSFATTKGLNQIVTPDIQNPGELSISLQGQHAEIGNAEQLQAELGLVPWLEVAAFEGFKPGEGIFGAEVALFQHEPYLLSTGAVNLSTRDGIAQPFLETGYYTEHTKWIFGAINVKDETEWMYGFAYDFDPHWRLSLDHQTGDENFSTVGVTYTLNDSLQVNPALFIGNTAPHTVLGYIVVTYTLKAWVPKNKKPADEPPAL